MTGEQDGWSEFKIELDTRVAYKDHWEAFQHRWSQLPPLVRAGIAEWMVEVAGKPNLASRITFATTMGLERRVAVLKRFNHGHGAVQQLFVALCKEADAEAVAKGIDADVKPEPVEGKRMFSIATKTWEPALPPKKKRVSARRKK